MTKRFFCTIALLSISCMMLMAQVGDYRNKFAVGIGGGYALNSVSFMPTVEQGMHGGLFGGLMGRYTTEKYFSTICSVQLELNLAQLGWKQNIRTIDDNPVINPLTNQTESYQRDITYVQIPLFAHLAWGKEKRGLNFFVNLGPQIGIMLSDKTKCNYTSAFTNENFPGDWNSETGRASSVVAQESMPVENKLDFGIALGAGIEADIKHIGRFDLEGRYYYGLGNLYGDSKRDYFGKSPNGTIFIRLSYLRDL